MHPQSSEMVFYPASFARGARTVANGFFYEYTVHAGLGLGTSRSRHDIFLCLFWRSGHAFSTVDSSVDRSLVNGNLAEGLQNPFFLCRLFLADYIVSLSVPAATQRLLSLLSTYHRKVNH